MSGEQNLGLLQIKAGYPNGRNPEGDNQLSGIASGIRVMVRARPLSLSSCPLLYRSLPVLLSCSYSLALPPSPCVWLCRRDESVDELLCGQGLREPRSPDDVFSTPAGWFTTQVDSTTGNLMIPGASTTACRRPPSLGCFFTPMALCVADPPESAPAAMRNPGQPTGGAYHVLDYTFFWANIRANVKERVGAFLAQSGAKL